MPPIRQATASPLQATGSTGPRASALSFGANASGLAQGLGQAAGALESVAAARQARDREAAEFARAEALEAKKDYDNSQQLAITEAGLDVDNFMSQWKSDPENFGKGRADAEKAFSVYLESAINSYGLQGEHQEEFRLRAKGARDGFLIENEVERKRKANSDFIVRTEQALNETVRRFFDSGDPRQMLEVHDDLKRKVQANFEGQDAIIQKQNVRLTTIVAESLLEESPELVEKFLKETADIAPDDRARIIDRARSLSKHRTAVEQMEHQEMVEQNLRDTGKNHKTPPLEPEQFRDKEEYDAYTFLHDRQAEKAKIVQSAKGKNPVAIAEMIESASGLSQEGRAAMELAIPELVDISDMAKKHSVDYVRFSNPDVKLAERRKAAALLAFRDNQDDRGAQEELHAAATEYNKEVLRAQGSGDGDYFLNQNRINWSLLSDDEAKQKAELILKADPKDLLGTWAEIMVEYPEHEHQWIAFQDIAENLEFEHIMSFYYQQEPWVETFIDSQRLSDEQVQSGIDEKLAEYQDEMNVHPVFQNFEQSHIDGGANRQYTIDAMESASKFAVHLAKVTGMKKSKAVDMAANRLFGSALYVDTGEGVLSFSRHKLDGTPLSDPEIDAIENFLPRAIDILDLEQVGTQNFVEAGEFAKEDRDAFVSGVILGEGNVRLQVDRDQMSIVLYGRKVEGGDWFIVEDNEGDPFRIHINDLPTRRSVTPGTKSFFGWNAPIRSKKMVGASNWPFGKPGGRPTDMRDIDRVKQFDPLF